MRTINISQAMADGNIGALTDALRSAESWSVRSDAAEALGKLKAASATADLIQAFRDRAWQVRQAASLALGGIPQALDLLVLALAESDPRVRSAAADSLGRIGDPAAVDSLLALIGDVPDRLDPLYNPAQDARHAVEYIAARAPDEVAEKCRAALRHPNRDIREFAAEMAGQLKDVRAVEDLIILLGDLNATGSASISGGPHPGFFQVYRIRSLAARALGLIGDPRGLEPLCSVLLDVAREPEERRSAAIGLGGLKDDRAVDALLEALYDSDVSSYAYSALKELRTPRAQSLLPLAEVLATLENRGLSREAVEAAAKLGDTRAVRSLVHCLERGLMMLDSPIREEGDAERGEHIGAIVRRIIGVLGAFDTVEARAALDKYGSFPLLTK